MSHNHKHFTLVSAGLCSSPEASLLSCFKILIHHFISNLLKQTQQLTTHSTCNLDKRICRRFHKRGKNTNFNAAMFKEKREKAEGASDSRNNDSPWQKELTDDTSREMWEILWNILSTIKTWVIHNFKESHSWCLTFCVLERQRAAKYLPMHVSHSWTITIGQRDVNKQCEGRFPCWFCDYYFEGWAVEEWPWSVCPSRQNIQLYSTNGVWLDVRVVRACGFGCLVEKSALTHKPKEVRMVRGSRKTKEAAESDEYRWQHKGQNMVWASLKGQWQIGVKQQKVLSFNPVW